MPTIARPRPALLVAVAGVLAAVAALAQEPAPSPPPAANPWVTLPAAKADVLVRVKFVLQVKVEGGGPEQDVDGEATCAMIDARGLVLCSNTELGGYFTLLGRMMGAPAGVTAVPKSIKVVAGSPETELDGQLVTRDSDRDLAWVKLSGVGERTFPAVDLDAGVAVAAGETVYAVRRMDEFFGRAPIARSTIVAGVVERPRRLLVPAEPIGVGFGLPVYTADGGLVGFTVLQMPGSEDQAEIFDQPLAFLGSALPLQEMVGGLVLPAAEAAAATALARESFADDFAF